jgi:hypothetical protein
VVRSRNGFAGLILGFLPSGFDFMRRHAELLKIVEIVCQFRKKFSVTIR